MNMPDAFTFQAADSIPDEHLVFFQVEATDGDTIWTSQFFIEAHAPVVELVEFSVDDSEGGNGDGHFDPGETVQITVTVINTGSSDAMDMMNELISNDTYISIISGAQSAGDLTVGSTIQSTFAVYADESTPGGFLASFIMETGGDMDVSWQVDFSVRVGLFTALILDLDPNQLSGPAILEAYSNLDLYPDYQTSFPEDLTAYRSIFLCLGIYFANHELTEAEALNLKNYLENGGNLYMEGRPTWYDDPETALHPMFNVNTIFQNWFEVDTLHGVSGTFTEEMTFGFESSINPYQKYYLTPSNPAFAILRHSDSYQNVWVANDAGAYKTVAANIEFGGLVDGEEPSTKEHLMMKILEFFGDIFTGTEDEKTMSDNNVIVYPNPFRDKVVFNFNLNTRSDVTLEVYHLTGQKAATVYEGTLPPGDNQLTWQTSETGSGMFFYRLKTNQQTLTGKLIRK
jgi:hypothetical protein